MEVKLPVEGTRGTCKPCYRRLLRNFSTGHTFVYRGYGRPAVPKVPVQALRACLRAYVPSHRSHGTLPLPSVVWCPSPAWARVRPAE